jgi:hypothetical protein
MNLMIQKTWQVTEGAWGELTWSRLLFMSSLLYQLSVRRLAGSNDEWMTVLTDLNGGHNVLDSHVVKSTSYTDGSRSAKLKATTWARWRLGHAKASQWKIV